MMCYLHELLRQSEWHVFHIIRTPIRTAKELNKWMADRGINFEIGPGDIEKPTFSYGALAKSWFHIDPLDGKKRLWETLIDFADEGREDTKNVWRAYQVMQEIAQLPYPTPTQVDEFETRTFDYFLAHSIRYAKNDTSHYCHADFMHAPQWMRAHASAALHKNEALEKLNPLDKQHQQNHCTHGGLGGDMCLDALLHNGRRLFRWCFGAVQEAIKPVKEMKFTEWCSQARGFGRQLNQLFE